MKIGHYCILEIYYICKENYKNGFIQIIKKFYIYL